MDEDRARGVGIRGRGRAFAWPIWLSSLRTETLTSFTVGQAEVCPAPSCLHRALARDRLPQPAVVVCHLKAHIAIGDFCGVHRWTPEVTAPFGRGSASNCGDASNYK